MKKLLSLSLMLSLSMQSFAAEESKSSESVIKQMKASKLVLQSVEKSNDETAKAILHATNIFYKVQSFLPVGELKDLSTGAKVTYGGAAAVLAGGIPLYLSAAVSVIPGGSAEFINTYSKYESLINSSTSIVTPLNDLASKLATFGNQYYSKGFKSIQNSIIGESSAYAFEASSKLFVKTVTFIVESYPTFVMKHTAPIFEKLGLLLLKKEGAKILGQSIAGSALVGSYGYVSYQSYQNFGPMLTSTFNMNDEQIIAAIGDHKDLNKFVNKSTQGFTGLFNLNLEQQTLLREELENDIIAHQLRVYRNDKVDEEERLKIPAYSTITTLKKVLSPSQLNTLAGLEVIFENPEVMKNLSTSIDSKAQTVEQLKQNALTLHVLGLLLLKTEGIDNVDSEVLKEAQEKGLELINKSEKMLKKALLLNKLQK